MTRNDLYNEIISLSDDGRRTLSECLMSYNRRIVDLNSGEALQVALVDLVPSRLPELELQKVDAIIIAMKFVGADGLKSINTLLQPHNLAIQVSTIVVNWSEP